MFKLKIKEPVDKDEINRLHSIKNYDSEIIRREMDPLDFIKNGKKLAKTLIEDIE
jgi:hypothetical protein